MHWDDCSEKNNVHHQMKQLLLETASRASKYSHPIKIFQLDWKWWCNQIGEWGCIKNVGPCHKYSFSIIFEDFVLFIGHKIRVKVTWIKVWTCWLVSQAPLQSVCFPLWTDVRTRETAALCPHPSLHFTDNVVAPLLSHHNMLGAIFTKAQSWASKSTSFVFIMQFPWKQICKSWISNPTIPLLCSRPE